MKHEFAKQLTKALSRIGQLLSTGSSMEQKEGLSLAEQNSGGLLARLKTKLTPRRRPHPIHPEPSETGLCLNPHPKLKANIFATTLFLSTFSLAFICGSLAFIKHDTNAEENYGNGDGTEGTIAFSIDNPHLVLPIDNSSLGQLVTGTMSLNVTTDNLTGYTLSMEATNPSNTSLVHTNQTDSIPSTTNSTPQELTVNTWGFNLATRDSGTSDIILPTTYKQIPSTQDIIKSTTTPTTDDETILAFGVKADMSNTAGLYSTEFTFTTVANFVPVAITNIAPSINAWKGNTITIHGEYLVDIESITVGGVECQNFAEISSTEATCVLPAHPADSRQNVVVNTVFGQSNTDRTVAYAAPIHPTTNWTGGDIYINKTSITAASTVTVGGSACQSTKFITEGVMRCTLPSKATGTSQDVVVDGVTVGNVTYDGELKGFMQSFDQTTPNMIQRISEIFERKPLISKEI